MPLAFPVTMVSFCWLEVLPQNLQVAITDYCGRCNMCDEMSPVFMSFNCFDFVVGLRCFRCHYSLLESADTSILPWYYEIGFERGLAAASASSSVCVEIGDSTPPVLWD